MNFYLFSSIFNYNPKHCHLTLFDLFLQAGEYQRPQILISTAPSTNMFNDIITSVRERERALDFHCLLCTATPGNYGGCEKQEQTDVREIYLFFLHCRKKICAKIHRGMKHVFLNLSQGGEKKVQEKNCGSNRSDGSRRMDLRDLGPDRLQQRLVFLIILKNSCSLTSPSPFRSASSIIS